jgi:hypothetical protein
MSLQSSYRERRAQHLRTTRRLDLLGKAIALRRDGDVSALVIAIRRSQRAAVVRAGKLCVVFAGEQVVVDFLPV